MHTLIKVLNTVLIVIIVNSIIHYNSNYITVVFTQDSSNSFDYFDSDTDPNPSPFDSHGTACAGEIGMVRGNTVCGVGVAYNSKVAGNFN